MNPLIIVAIQEIPALIAWLREAFTEANPEAPVPTDDEVLIAYQTALVSSLSRDAAWLAQHPEDPDSPEVES